MKLESLKDLYLEQLKDLYSAETQLLDALPRMAAGASAHDLNLGESSKGHTCEAKAFSSQGTYTVRAAGTAEQFSA